MTTRQIWEKIDQKKGGGEETTMFLLATEAARMAGAQQPRNAPRSSDSS